VCGKPRRYEISHRLLSRLARYRVAPYGTKFADSRFTSARALVICAVIQTSDGEQATAGSLYMARNLEIGSSS